MDCAKEDFWLAQRNATTLPAVGFATTVDINAHVTHPPDKQLVAVRISNELRRLANSSLGGGAAGAPTRPKLLAVTSGGGGTSAPAVVFTFGAPVESQSGGVGGGGGPASQGCGGGGGDGTAVDYGTALPKQRFPSLNYSVAGASVTVQCGSNPNAVVQLSARTTGCFLYSLPGGSGGGLPVAPVCAFCNDTKVACAPNV